jgi:hypothetical protein
LARLFRTQRENLPWWCVMDLIGSLRFSLAIDAFNRRPLSRAFRPFVEPILKGSSGSTAEVRLVAAAQ